MHEPILTLVTTEGYNTHMLNTHHQQHSTSDLKQGDLGKENLCQITTKKNDLFRYQKKESITKFSSIIVSVTRILSVTEE